MRKTILIVSNANDLHALAVRRELLKISCNAYLLECDRLSKHNLNFGFDQEPYLKIDDQYIEVSEISTIWWRRPSLNQHFQENILDDDQVDFINKNCTSALRSFLLSTFSGKWVSSPEFTDRAANKLYQLKISLEQGFRIPDTLISNDPDAVRIFYEKHHGNIIVKALRNSGRKFLATQKVDLEMLSDNQIRMVPSIYQELISGTKHLRVNCFGNEVYAALIETNDLDWRPNINVPITVFPIDAQLKSRIVDLLSVFNLRMGIMDFKISHQDELVWFEVNPQGQFLFLEPLTKQDLLTNFTNFLLRE